MRALDSSRRHYASRAVLIVALIAHGFGAPLLAQGADDFTKRTIDDLRPPISPAFVLLGIEPSSVQRPADHRALTTTLLSLAGDKTGIPRNFAMEVTPFWLRSQPTIEFDSMYTSNVLLNVRMTSSFSFATAPRVLDNDTTGTSIGFGYRTLLFNGSKSTKLAGLQKRLVTGLGECAERPAEQLESCNDSLQSLSDSVQANMQPVGFRLELSAAGSAEYPDDATEGSHWKRVGVWLSPSYRMSNQIELVGVTRLIRERVAASDTTRPTILDYGFRLLWRVNDAIALSGEALQRRASGNDLPSQTLKRFGALLEVRAHDDNYVFYSFGQDFAAKDAPRTKIFATLGLNLGFGRKPLVKMPE